MIKTQIKIKFFLFTIILLFIIPQISNAYVLNPNISQKQNEIFLPPPQEINASIEELLHHRTCIRSFSDEALTYEQLSCILWSAVGFINETQRTINPIQGNIAVKIYVILEDAVYYYNAKNHSLIFHKSGDYRHIGQYWAPVLLGLTWDRSLNTDEYIVGTQIGQIAQNIILSATSIGLGTVPTNDFIIPLLNIDLPINECGKLVMPLGHPKRSTIWKYRSNFISSLPKPIDSSSKLSQLFENLSLTYSFDEKGLSRRNISQLLWACYGYSFFIDVPTQKSFFGQRHRTVPSGHGYYPLEIYAVNQKGIYRYIPGITHMDSFGIPIFSFLNIRRLGDYRQVIAESSESFVKDSPFLIISVLNIKHTEKRGLRGDDFSSPEYRWIWYYEAGSCTQNALLEAQAWGLKGNIVEINNQEKILDLLKLNEDYIPMFVVPIGFVKDT